MPARRKGNPRHQPQLEDEGPIELRAPRPGLYQCRWCGAKVESMKPRVTCSPSCRAMLARARAREGL